MGEQHLEADIVLHEPNGMPHPAHIVAARHAGGDDTGEPLDVRVSVDLAWDDYEMIELLEMLHLTQRVRGPISGGTLTEGQDVRIEARLARSLADAAFPDGDPARVVDRLADLTEEHPDDPLLETESWYALTVTQAMDLPPDLAARGTVRTGYRTTWAEAETVGDEA